MVLRLHRQPSLPTSQSHLRGGVLLAIITSLDLPWRRVFSVWRRPRQYLPDFITNARRELMLSIAFFYMTKEITFKK